METVYDPAATLAEDRAVRARGVRRRATRATQGHCDIGHGQVVRIGDDFDTVTFAAQLGEASNTARNALISATVARPRTSCAQRRFTCRTVSVRRTRSCRSPDQG